MSYVRTLTIRLLLVYSVSVAGCHCFDLLVLARNVLELYDSVYPCEQVPKPDLREQSTFPFQKSDRLR